MRNLRSYILILFSLLLLFFSVFKLNSVMVQDQITILAYLKSNYLVVGQNMLEGLSGVAVHAGPENKLISKLEQISENIILTLNKNSGDGYYFQNSDQSAHFNLYKRGQDYMLFNNVNPDQYLIGDTQVFTLNSANNIIINEAQLLAKDIPIKKGYNRFQFYPKQGNLIGNQNYSFESGVWTDNVNDCSDTMLGVAVFSMELSNEATDGKNSILISSKNHSACTNQTFVANLERDKLYKLFFDYKNLRGNMIQYYYKLSNSNNEIQEYSNTLEVIGDQWINYETIINPEIDNVNMVNIHLYAPSSGQEIINLYDNIKIIEYMPKDIADYYLHKKKNVSDSGAFKAVEYKNVNSHKSIINIHNAKGSFLIYYPKEFSRTWQAYVYSRFLKGNLDTPFDYTVSENNSIRQASANELRTFIDSGIISNIGSDYISKNFNNSIRNDNLIDPPLTFTYVNRPLHSDYHFEVNNYGNAWLIDVDDICHNTNKCQPNNDGTYDLSLLIENKLSKILDIGFIVALLCCVVQLFFIYMKNKKPRQIICKSS